MQRCDDININIITSEELKAGILRATIILYNKLPYTF